MSVRIRLQRKGRPKRPFYRVVAIDKRDRRDGRPIEFLGQYDPMAKSGKIKVNQERVDYWLKQGAQPSKTVASLLKKGSKVAAKKETKAVETVPEAES